MTSTIQTGRILRPAPAVAAIILACGIFTPTTATATDNSGNIAGETWTKAMSPIRIIGDTTVFNLTIKPGVEIVFTGNFFFEPTKIQFSARPQQMPLDKEITITTKI